MTASVAANPSGVSAATSAYAMSSRFAPISNFPPRRSSEQVGEDQQQWDDDHEQRDRPQDDERPVHALAFALAEELVGFHPDGSKRDRHLLPSSRRGDSRVRLLSRPVRTYFRSLDPQLPRDVYVLQFGGLLNAFGNGVVLPFLIIYLHNVRGISLGLAGLAAATQSATALASGFVGGTLSDRIGAKRVLLGTLAIMTVAFALMPLIRSALEAFAVYVLWGIGSGSFWPSQSALL